MKTCKKCNETKCQEDFGKDRKRPDGLCVYCKACRKKKAAEEETDLFRKLEKQIARLEKRLDNLEIRLPRLVEAETKRPSIFSRPTNQDDGEGIEVVGMHDDE